MEEEDEETTPTTSQTSSTITLTQQSVCLSRATSTTTLHAGKTEAIPQFQMITHQASGDSLESEESASLQASPRYSALSKSPHSSSSQEDYEPAKGKFLSAGVRAETTKSMESLRATSRSFLSTSERDMRRLVAESVETKSLESLEREMRLKRHAVSGEGALLSCSGGSLLTSEEAISAEKRRGLWSGRARVPQHLSLPPPAGYLSLSPGDRKLTILSPHSPHRMMPDFLHLSQATLKTRRKKAMVLPRLVLPRSDSEISEVFSEHGLE